MCLAGVHENDLCFSVWFVRDNVQRRILINFLSSCLISEGGRERRFGMISGNLVLMAAPHSYIQVMGADEK